MAVDANGASASFVERSARNVDLTDAVAAVGEDGTAAVAWTGERTSNLDPVPNVWLRVRAPGGQFEATQIIRTGTLNGLDVAVAPDGLVEIVYSSGRGVFDFQRRVGALAGTFSRVAAVAGSPTEVAVAADAHGQERVLFGTEGLDGRLTLFAVMRAEELSWSPAQLLATGVEMSSETLASQADGSAVVAYTRLVAVRRAGPGAPLEPEVQVEALPRGWLSYDNAAAGGSRGDLLIAWIEGDEKEDPVFGALCGGSCHSRVMATAAGPDGRFGPATRISALGTVAGTRHRWPSPSRRRRSARGMAIRSRRHLPTRRAGRRARTCGLGPDPGSRSSAAESNGVRVIGERARRCGCASAAAKPARYGSRSSQPPIPINTTSTTCQRSSARTPAPRAHAGASTRRSATGHADWPTTATSGSSPTPPTPKQVSDVAQRWPKGSSAARRAEQALTRDDSQGRR